MCALWCYKHYSPIIHTMLKLRTCAMVGKSVACVCMFSLLSRTLALPNKNSKMLKPSPRFWASAWSPKWISSDGPCWSLRKRLCTWNSGRKNWCLIPCCNSQIQYPSEIPVAICEEFTRWVNFTELYYFTNLFFVISEIKWNKMK